MGIFRTIILSGILFLITTSGLLAQSKDSTDTFLIQGLWIADAEVQVQQSIQFSRNSQKPLTEKHMERQLEGFKSRTYVFHEGGFFETSWSTYGDTKVVYGKWELITSGELSIGFEDQSTVLYKVELRKGGILITPKSSGGDEVQPIYLKRAVL